MISTRELAVLAGVSQSTVSRCLNDHPAISMKTKERIRKIALSNGYSLKSYDRKKILSYNKRKTIGILFTGRAFFDDLFINYTLNMLIACIAGRNFFPMPLMDLSSKNEGIARLRDIIQTGNLAGFIILSRYYDEGIHQYLNDFGIPHVYLLHYSRDIVDSVDIVDSDNFGGGYLGTKHLLDYGHRQILTLSCPYREFDDRTSGYRKALLESGETLRDDMRLVGDGSIKSAYDLIAANIKLVKQTTAVYAQTDLMAFGAIQALNEAGLKVPGDISVIGSDGYELGLMCRPHFDSVAHPLRELTELAVNRLLEIGETSHPQAPRRQILRPYVIHRESVRRI
jgi:LacI family transcriptional regulator